MDLIFNINLNNKDDGFIRGHRLTNKEILIMQLIEEDLAYQRTKEFFKYYNVGQVDRTIKGEK